MTRREKHKQYMKERRAKGIDVYRPHDWRWRAIVAVYLPLLEKK